MREKFKNLGETYRKSNLSDRRVLLVSIAPKGLHWQYSGYSKQEIGSLYQAILNIEKTHFAFGDPSVSYVEHLDKVIKDYKRIYKLMSPLLNWSL